MEFEWEEPKREWTRLERGLDFVDVAEADWDDAMTVEDSRSDYGEARFVSLVSIRARLCVVAWCWRDERMRVISLRKANAKERKIYDES